MKHSPRYSVSVIVVTHNSSPCIRHCIHSLNSQTVVPACIIIVDSGSSDRGYLDPYRNRDRITVIEKENIGYGAANNVGLCHIAPDSDFFLLINPDTFLTETFIEQAIEVADKYEDASILTGVLESYDLENNCPAGRIDSTGVFRKWYGRWYDRGLGEAVDDYVLPDEGLIPAACGALMFCRRSFFYDDLPNLFDERFFLYKEDIELSIRVQKKGGKLFFIPSLKAYHCRGWDQVRNKVLRTHRLMSSFNEVQLYKIHPSPYMLWALFKYTLVRVFNL
jgi:GT2 family glycosyltransferase